MSPIATLSVQLEINDKILIINEDKINVNLIDGPSSIADWVEVLCDSISLDITRSLNTSQSILGSPDAAELVVVITNPRYDPATNKFVKPNTAVKVLSNNEVIFTGTILSADTDYVVDKNTGKLSTNITLSAHDATDVFVNTTGYAPTQQNFNARVNYLAGLAGVSTEPMIFPSILVKDWTSNFYTGVWTDMSGTTPTRAGDGLSATWDFTATPAQASDKLFVLQGEYWSESDWEDRAADTYRVSCTFYNNGQPVESPGRVRMIESWYTDNPYFGGTFISSTAGSWVTNADDVLDLDIPAGSVPANAKWWRMRVEWESQTLSSSAVNRAEMRIFPESGDTYPKAQFTAYSSAAGGVTLSPHENDATLWELMEMAVNSEVGMAFVNRQGKLEARYYGNLIGAHSPILHFSNVHDDLDPLHTCFTDMEVVYDTQNVVNELEITNVVNKGQGDFEEVVDTYTDAQSLYDYGPRRSTLRTNLTTEPDIANSAARVLDLFAMSEKRVRKIVFNPETPAQTLVDLGDYITFHLALDGSEFRGNYVIVGVEHDVYPGSWVTTLELERAR